MEKHKLLRVGNSLALVVSRNYARRLGWKQGDALVSSIVNDQLVVQGVLQPKIQFMHTIRDFGDARTNQS